MPAVKNCLTAGLLWAFSSVGRASGLHPEGREFKSLNAHHYYIMWGCSSVG